MTTSTALVTGAASGIGAATCAQLRAAGYDVIATDLAGTGPGMLHADVAEPADWARVASAVHERFGTLQLAHLNAGVPSRQPHIGELTDAQFQRTIAVNLGGVVYGVRALLPLMAPGGSFVVTCSIAGMRPANLDPIYTASKHAVIGLVRSIADDLAARSIRINAICPSYVDTPMAKGNPALVDRLNDVGARWLSPADVADGVLAIAAADYTGQAMVCMPGQLYAYRFEPIVEPH